MKTYRLSIYDFQPIHIDINLLLDLYRQNYKKDKLSSDFFSFQKKPEWMVNFDRLNETFHPIHSIAIDTDVEFDFLTKLTNTFQIDNNHNLCSLHAKQAYLLFDPRLFSFMLSVEIVIDISEKQLIYLNKQDQPNFYQAIRQQLVNDDVSTQVHLSEWSSDIKKLALNTTIKICNKIKKSKDVAKKIYIPDNTGNISCVLTAHDKNGFCHVAESVQRIFLKINKHAERLITDQAPIKLPNKIDNSYDLIDFNGRMHTLVINNPKNQYRYIPIMLHMQFMWFYIKSISPYFSSNIVSIICNNNDKSNSDLEDNIHALIKRIEVLSIYNEQFKFSIEIDNELIYEKIQTRWSIEKTLKQLQKNAGAFGKQVIRDNENARARSDQFKNAVLAIISIIQILALTSIWNDHLSLIDRQQNASTVFYATWIELINYNLLPSLLIISSLIGLIFLIKRNK